MLVLDVYALVAVFRADHPHHAMVRPWWDRTLTEPSRPVVVPDIVWVGFVRVVTSRRIFTVAATVEEAFAFAEAVRAHPAYRTFSPSAHVFAEFARMCRQDQVSGNLVTDAWIAATALVLAAPVVTLDATSGASTDWASSRRRHDGRVEAPTGRDDQVDPVTGSPRARPRRAACRGVLTPYAVSRSRAG